MNTSISNGIDTLIDFLTPIKVRFKTGNLIPLQHLNPTIVGEVEEEYGEIDVESQPLPDDVMYGAVGKHTLVEVPATSLLVATRRMPWEQYRTFVERVGEHYLPEYVMTDPPILYIEDFGLITTQIEAEALNNHRNLVQRVLTYHSSNQPRIVYEGLYLLAARIKGDKIFYARREAEELNKK